MATSVYVLYNFNSYHNRVLKKFDTLNEYLTGYSYDVIANANFDYKDGVTSSVTYNLGAGFNYDNSPNYALVVDNTNGILSRWYVVDGIKTRGGQYVLTLLRDGIADYKDDVLSAPCFVEKGQVASINNLIFTDEGISVNKIKQGYELLKDESKVAWIVGYTSRKGIDGQTFTPISVSYTPTTDADYIYTDVASFNNSFAFKNNSTFTDGESGLPTTKTDVEVCNKYFLQVVYYNANAITANKYQGFRYTWSPNSSNITDSWLTRDTQDGLSNDLHDDYTNISAGVYCRNFKYHLNTSSVIAVGRVRNDIEDRIYDNQGTLQPALRRMPSGNDYKFNTLDEYDNKIFKIGSNYYNCTIVRGSGDRKLLAQANGGPSTSGPVAQLLNAADWSSVDAGYDGCFLGGTICEPYYLQFTKVQLNSINFTLSGNEAGLDNIPYRMFAIPYSQDTTPVSFTNEGGSSVQFTMSPEVAINVGNLLSAKLTGSGALYDMQILPYCPVRGWINGDHSMQKPSAAASYTLVKDGSDNNIGLIYWCSTNQFTFDINKNIQPTDIKLESITDTYRLSSPNWNGQFEFNPAKNGGVTKFNVDCTYKPHMPYIHINPDFSRLYGADYNDARGLICSGDFSLPQISDAWNTYEMQNKNYQQQFQRQIDNLEINHKYDMSQAGISALLGAGSGAAAGAVAGSVIPGVGTAIGAAVGGITSLAGAAADMGFAQAKYNEQISYTKDMHRMQLENIQALPANLTNVGALTYNNMIWPVLEHYSCSQEEKEAIVEYLKYYGMSVGVVGALIDYINKYPEYNVEGQTFVAGQLIRLNLDDDNHIVDHIYNEIKKGVFI